MTKKVFPVKRQREAARRLLDTVCSRPPKTPPNAHQRSDPKIRNLIKNFGV